MSGRNRRKKTKIATPQAEVPLEQKNVSLAHAKPGTIETTATKNHLENVNADLASVLFRSWVAIAELTAFRIMLIYLVISLIAAFLIGLLRLPEEVAHRISLTFQVVLCITFGMLFLRGRHLLTPKKPPTSPALNIALPKDLKYLKYLKDFESPEWFKNLSKSKQLKTFAESLKDEFTFWNDRLKNLSAIVLAAGVFLGVQYRTDTWFLDVVAIVTSWAFLVGLLMSGVTQNALRYLKSEQLKEESLESQNQLVSSST